MIKRALLIPAILLFVSSVQAEHLYSFAPEGHFFLPSRTLFFFRPDLYIQAHRTFLYYSPPVYRRSLYSTGTAVSPSRSYRVYPVVFSGGLSGEIVRANTSDLILKVNPPEALVYVDKKLIGSAGDFSTERDRYSLLEGEHHVRIEFPGYEPFEAEMDIMADRTLHLEIELEESTSQ